MALTVTRYDGQLYHVQYQKKLMIQSWENLVTGGQTSRQTDENDFIGRFPINVERPTNWFIYFQSVID